MVGAIFTPKFINGGGIFSRTTKGAGAGAAAEVPTELGQQVLERLQAGKDITSEEAIKEYRDVAITAGLVGGSIRGTSNLIAGDRNKKDHAEKTRQLDEDFRELQQEVHGNAALGLKKKNELAPDPSVKSEVIKQGNQVEAQQQAILKAQEAAVAGTSRLNLKDSLKKSSLHWVSTDRRLAHHNAPLQLLQNSEMLALLIERIQYRNSNLALSTLRWRIGLQ